MRITTSIGHGELPTSDGHAMPSRVPYLAFLLHLYEVLCRVVKMMAADVEQK
jgi:hypothetical protein